MYVRPKVRKDGRRQSNEGDSKGRRARNDSMHMEDYDGYAEYLIKRDGISDKHAEPRPVDKEMECVVVAPGDLQATFENLVGVISEGRGNSLERSSVIGMIESIYEWMVFDPNSQIALPKEPGSQGASRMWPQGSKIDTRKTADRSKVESSPRRLRSMGADHACTVASSVVSSTLEEEGMKVRKGSVVYVGNRQPTHVTYNGSHMNSLMEEGERYSGLQYRGQEYQHPQQGQHAQQDQYYHAPLTHNPAPYDTRSTQRYSILGQPIEPPSRVEETPQQTPAVPVKRMKMVKKVKVGSSSRAHTGAEGDIVFAE